MDLDSPTPAGVAAGGAGAGAGATSTAAAGGMAFPVAAPAPAPAPAPAAVPQAASTLPAAPAAGTAPAQPLFGAVIAGRPMIVNFTQVSPTKFALQIPQPKEIGEITIFLLPNCPLPAHLGITIFWAAEPYKDWNLLGALTVHKPSNIFRTGWPEHPDVKTTSTIQLGLSAESLSVVANVAEAVYAKESSQLAFAMQVAKDLYVQHEVCVLAKYRGQLTEAHVLLCIRYNYMGSFTQSTAAGDKLVVPTGVLDRWMTRFKTKFEKDDSFLKKK